MEAHQRVVHDEIEELQTQVITTVAERKGIDPIDLTPSLHSAIDPDALEALFSERDNGFVHVEFTYAGVDKTIEGEGDVEIEIV